MGIEAALKNTCSQMHKGVFGFYQVGIKNNAHIDLTDTGIINLNLNYEERIRKANSLKS